MVDSRCFIRNLKFELINELETKYLSILNKRNFLDENSVSFIEEEVKITFGILKKVDDKNKLNKLNVNSSRQ